MKHRIIITRMALLLAAVLIATTPSIAQSFKIGVKGGLTFGGLKMSDDDKSPNDLYHNDNQRVGFNVGMTIQYIGRSGFGVDLSVLYARTEYGYWDEDRIRKDMLDMPLHLTFHIPTGVNKTFSPFLYTGPDLMCNFTDNRYSWYDRYDDRYYGDYYYRPVRTVFSWDVGIGAMFFNHVQVQAGYTFGISNSFEDNHNTSYGKSRVWNISAAVVF